MLQRAAAGATIATALIVIGERAWRVVDRMDPWVLLELTLGFIFAVSLSIWIRERGRERQARWAAFLKEFQELKRYVMWIDPVTGHDRSGSLEARLNATVDAFVKRHREEQHGEKI